MQIRQEGFADVGRRSRQDFCSHGVIPLIAVKKVVYTYFL